MLVIHADWDSEAGCWYATSDDVPGLATGADTIEDLIERLKVIVPELVELNEIPVAERVSFELRARRRAIADAAARCRTTRLQSNGRSEQPEPTESDREGEITKSGTARSAVGIS